MDDRLLSITEAAQRIGVTRGRIWQLIREEQSLPATRLGHFWFVAPADLEPFKFQDRGRPRKGRQCA